MTAIFQSTSNWMISAKTVLISCSVVLMAVVLKQTVSLSLDSSVSGFLMRWSSFRSRIELPYLYFVVNGIILAIAVFSKLCRKVDEENELQNTAMADIQKDFVYDAKAVEVLPEFAYESNTVEVPPEFEPEVKLLDTIMPDLGFIETPEVVYEQIEGNISASEVNTVTDDLAVEDGKEKFVISMSNWSPENIMNLSEAILPREKPPVSSRFSHRKPVKSSPEGVKSLKVSKPKRQETLETTWKTITDGRHVPLTRHHRRSETWENHSRESHTLPLDRKSIQPETFKDRTNNPSSSPVTSTPASSRLRKEPSLSTDELNRRVEAFIRKVNEDIRLQREESLSQYEDMINRGA